MPLFDNEFTCSNGHTFRANAKLRTRCPNCGVMARMVFNPSTGTTPNKEPVHKKAEPVTKTVLLKTGRPRLPTPVVKEPEKPIMTAKKSKGPIRKTAAKAPVKKVAPTGRVSAGIVKTSHIKTKGVMPTVTRKPKRTAVARHIKVPTAKRSYSESIYERFMP